MRTYNEILNEYTYAYSVPLMGNEFDNIEGYPEFTQFNIWMWTSEASMVFLYDRRKNPQDYFIDEIDEYNVAHYSGNDNAIERVWKIFNQKYIQTFEQ